MTFIKKLRRSEVAGTAIEYGLIAALIAVAAITAMQGIGSELNTSFSSTSSSLAS
jgi:pilus assembly protein Flp/PilA